jgi:hypothetical protein
METYGIVCFFVDVTPPRDRWKLGITTRPVIEATKTVSRTLKVKVYAAHTLYGGPPLVQKLEGYLARYDLGDGWYGPLTTEVMGEIVRRIRAEGSGFLEVENLP